MPDGQPGSNLTSEGNAAIDQAGADLHDLTVSGSLKKVDCSNASEDSSKKETATHVPSDAAPAAHAAAQLLGYRMRVRHNMPLY